MKKIEPEQQLCGCGGAGKQVRFDVSHEPESPLLALAELVAEAEARAEADAARAEAEETARREGRILRDAELRLGD